MAERPGDRVRRRFTGTATPLIEGKPRPPVDVVVEWGGSPLFMLSSPRQAAGGLLWVVAGDDDAELTPDEAGVTVTLGPSHAPTAPPIWWAAVASPMGAGFDRPIEARTGIARLSVRGDDLSGTVRLSGVGLDGGHAGYEATITGHPAEDAEVPPGPATAEGAGIPPRPATPGGAGIPPRPATPGDAGIPQGPVAAGEEPHGPFSPIERLNALSRRISLDFAAGQLGALIGHLRDAADLRRELSVGDAATGAWGRFLADVRDSLAFDRRVLASIAERGHLHALPWHLSTRSAPTPIRPRVSHGFVPLPVRLDKGS
ncbi:hypothetical protein AB0B89_11370, partial [Sphaerisporangium sp. NPDC049002]